MIDFNKELYFKTKKALDTFNELYNLLIETSALCGGAILLDTHEAKKLLSEKVKLSKAYHQESNDSLAEVINEVNNKILTLKASKKDDELFNELEANFEIGLNLGLTAKALAIQIL